MPTPRRLLAAASLFLLALRLGAVPPPAEEFEAWRAALARGGAREEGSLAERAAAAYVRSALAGMGVGTATLPYPPGTHSFSPQFIARAGGGESKQLVLAVPLSQDDGATDGSEGSWALAASMLLLRMAKASAPGFDLVVAYLGGERVPPELDDSAEGGLGARSLSLWLGGERARAVIYLGPGDAPAGFDLGTGAPGAICPFWLHSLVAQELTASGFSIGQPGAANILYRVGLYAKRSAIAPFLRASQPAILLSPAGAGADPAGAAERFAAAVLGVGRGALLEVWDRHYLPLAVGSTVVALREGQLVYVVFAAIALSISAFALYSLVRRRRMIRETRGLAARAWALPLSYAAVAGLLVLGYFLAALVAGARGIDPLAPDFAPGALAAELAVAVAGAFVLFLATPLARTSGMGRALSLFAGIVLFLDTIIYSFVDLSVAVFFLWSFLWALPAIASSSRILRAVCALASPLWVFFFLTDLARRPEDADFSLIVAPGAAPLLAFIILPFLLLALGVLVGRRGPRARGAGRWPRVAGCGAAAVFPLAALLWLGLSDPYARAMPANLALSRAAGSEGGLPRVVALGPGGERVPVVRIERERSADGRLLSAGKGPAGAAQSAATPSPPAVAVPPVSVGASSRSFLDRENIVYAFEFAGEPERVELVLRAARGVVVLDCDFPCETSASGESARIFVGRRPGRKLAVELTLPKGSAPVLTWRALFASGTPMADAAGRPFLLLGREYWTGTE